MAKIYCPSCGSDCPADANFCLKCGKALPRDYSSLPPKKESDFITLACPNCGGSLKITQDMERFACQYCGYEHLVRRNGGVVSLQPVMEGLKRVEDKFDHVLSGSDRMAAEQTIQRLKGEIVDLEKRIGASEKLIQKRSSQLSASIVFMVVSLLLIGYSLYSIINWTVSTDMFLLVVLFLVGVGVGFMSILGLAASTKGQIDIQKTKAELSALNAGLESRKQQLEKLHRYTTER